MSKDPNLVTPREMADQRPIANSDPRATVSERVVAPLLDL